MHKSHPASRSCTISLAGLHLLRLGVHIPIHGHADVGMPGDLLQGFDIAALACCIGEAAVTEYMSCCAVKVNGFFDTVIQFIE